MAQALATGAVTLVALFVRTNLGFGFSLVFIPLGSLVLGFDVAFRTAVALELLVGCILVIELRHLLRWGEAISLKIWSLAGLAAGVASQAVVTAPVVVTGAMAVVMSACGWLLLGDSWRNREPTRRGRLIAGALSGFLNFWTSLSGPPVVIYYLATEKQTDAVRGALTGYFVILYTATFCTLTVAGRYRGFHGWGGVLVGTVAVLLGYPVARQVARRMRHDIGRPSLILLIVAALAVIGQELM